MVTTGYTKLTNSLKTFFLGVILTHFSLTLITNLISLLTYSSDCKAPIRTWLITSTSVSGALCLVYFLQAYLGTGLWFLWQLVWSIVGIFWLSQGDCSSAFASGYTVSLSIILLNFALILMMVSLSCLFSIALCIGYGLSSRYQEISE